MTPIGLGLFTLGFMGKFLRRDDRVLINVPGTFDLVSQKVLEDSQATPETHKTGLEKPANFWAGDERIVTNEDTIPGWLAYLGMCHN